MSDANYLSLQNLSLAYGSTMAVKDLNLDIRKGELLALLGPSGCGKTTTMRAIAGLMPVAGGRIDLDGADITRVSANKRAVGLVFQSYALFPHLTVFENVAFGLRLKGIKGTPLDEKVASGLKSVGLSNFASRKPAELSGGQQQRVALARALITQPDVVLLDEPLSALDPFLRIRMRKELKAIQKQLGLTFIHVTHSQEEAFALADLAVVMDAGKIQQVAPPRELFERPATPFVAQFIGGHSLMRGEVTAREADRVVLSVEGAGQGSLSLEQLGDAYAEAAVGTPLAFSVRCDHLDILPPGSAPSAGQFGLPARVCDVEFQGAFIYVECLAASATPLMVYLADRQRQVPEVGAEVTLVWDAAHLNLFSPHHANPITEIH